MKRKRYSRKFQRMAVERMRNSENVGDLAQELGVTRRCLYKWRTKLDLVESGEEWALILFDPKSSQDSRQNRTVDEW